MSPSTWVIAAPGSKRRSPDQIMSLARLAAETGGAAPAHLKSPPAAGAVSLRDDQKRHLEVPVQRRPRRPRCPRSAEPELLFLHAKSNRRRRPALRSVCSSTARAEHGHQRFAVVAINRAVSVHRTDIDRRRLALVSLVALWSLWTLRALCASWSLRTRNALDALSTLRAGGALRSRLTLRPWFSSTSRKCEGNCKRRYAD
jgi:hypothetical protein